MTTDVNTAGALKGREGVPSWDGSAETYQAYRESALLFEQTTPYHKRYLVAPKLLSELQGSARRLIVGQDPEWVSYNGGVTFLLDHLRRCLGKPQVPELTELLAKYFKSSKRRPGETMGDYISRKCELYVRAQQAMSRLQPHHEAPRTGMTSWQWQPPFPRSGRRMSGESWQSAEVGTEPDSEANTEFQAAAPTAAATPTADAAAEPETETWPRQSWGSSWWQSHSSWNWSGGSPWEWESSWSSSRSRTVQKLPDLVPEFVQAWMLLQDASLEAADRNSVVVATQGDMSLQRVAQELRNQFPDHELKKKDTHKKHHSFWGSTPDEDDGFDETSEYPETSFNAEAELTEEGWAMWSEGEQEAQQALATLQHARRTLKGARERQKQVKQNRQYYRSGPPQRSTTSGSRDEGITCMRCGKQGHRAAVCPAPAPQGAKSTEMAPFICFAENETEAPTEVCAAEGISTADAVEAGKAVLDCGATKSLGSVVALENIMKRSQHGVSRVDVNDRPLFSFGNSSEDQCVSTLHLKVAAAGRPGVIKIHALDRGSAPVLLSVNALRSLGAILDFSEDCVVFRNVDPKKILQLEQSNSGHLLLPLTGDILAGAVDAHTAVPSLKAFCQPTDVPRVKPFGVDGEDPVTSSAAVNARVFKTKFAVEPSSVAVE